MKKRYSRNIGALTEAQFQSLQEKSVCVIGCGGLGGYIIEEFLRLGVKKITAVDYDVFDESNLNRQILATEKTLGKNKALSAVDRGQVVNPDVEINPISEKFTLENGAKIVEGHDLVIDALDNVTSRLELSNICSIANIPIVHGAIEECALQIAFILPNSKLLETIYKDSVISNIPSSLVPTVAICASLQVMESIKYFCNLDQPAIGYLLHFDLLSMEIDKIEFQENN